MLFPSHDRGGCYGEFLRVNGVNSEDMHKESKIELLSDIIINSPNGRILLEDCLLMGLQHLEFECSDCTRSYCEQCFEHNYSETYVRDEEE